jgi:probable 2-oxoglutarate dehydrogenase E1 component DHKTD1
VVYFQFCSFLSDDPNVSNPANVSTLIFCSGKHYYAVEKERARRNLNEAAIVRLELLSPFPSVDLQQTLAKYPNARTFVWSQEEHRNSGAWTFVKPRFENLGVKVSLVALVPAFCPILGARLSSPLLTFSCAAFQLTYAGRSESSVPAVGSTVVHAKEAQQVLVDTFECFDKSFTTAA